MKYLYAYPGNIYNNEQPSYEISPLPGSKMTRCVVFSGKSPLNEKMPRCTYVYTETPDAISEEDRYHNQFFLEQLLGLATGLPTSPVLPVPIEQDQSFEALFGNHRSEDHYDEGVNHAGLVRDENTIARMQRYSELLQGLSAKDLLKFQNALQTYAWVRDIEALPNPQLKYTLFMTLYLSAINQLADNPKPKCPSFLVCPDCGESTNMKHQNGSHGEEMEKLMKSLFTGSRVGEGIRLVKTLYDLRSRYLHQGLLSGQERQGGFMTSKASTKLLEDMVNISVSVRQILELFLQDRATSPATQNS